MTKRSVHNLFNQSNTNVCINHQSCTYRRGNANIVKAYTGTCHLDNLPPELLMAINQYLGMVDLSRLARTNKKQKASVYATFIPPFKIWDKNHLNRRYLRHATFREMTKDHNEQRVYRKAAHHAYKEKLSTIKTIHNFYSLLSDMKDNPKVQTAAYTILCALNLLAILEAHNTLMPDSSETNPYLTFGAYSLFLLGAIASPVASHIIYAIAGYCMDELSQRTRTRYYRYINDREDEIDGYLAEHPPRIIGP